MEDEKLLEKIKDSAEDVDIPEILQPENIKKGLEEKGKRKVFSFRKYAGWAAAIVVIFICGAIAGTYRNQGTVATGRRNTSNEDTVKTETAETEIAKTDTAQAGIAQTDTVKTEAGKTDTTQTGSAETDTVKTEAAEMDTTTGTSEKDIVKTEAAEMDTPQTDTTKADAAEMDTPQTDTTQTDTTKSDALDHQDSSDDNNQGIIHVSTYEELYDIVQEKTAAAGEYADGVYAVSENMDIAYEEKMDTGAEAGAVEEIAEEADVVTDTAASSGGGVAENDFSSTNTQEEDIDEADLVKTDGTYIYVLDQEGKIRIIKASSMTLAGEISCSGEVSDRIEEMYVQGSLLQVITVGTEYVTSYGEIHMSPEKQPVSPEEYHMSPSTDNFLLLGEDEEDSQEDDRVRTYYSVPTTVTTVVTYDISDKANPVKTGSYRQDGRYLTSRKNGEYLYLFTAYYPQSCYGYENKEYYVPKAGGVFLPCEKIYLPEEEAEGAYCGNYSGKAYLVGGSVFDGEPDKPADRMAVLGCGETYYVSQNNIYAASCQWDDDSGYTDLACLGYEDGRFISGRSRRVPGELNNSFSMNEYQGYLRMVTTKNQWSQRKNGDGSMESTFTRSNGLYVLDENLKIVGKIENLAKDEEIKSARFLGDTGYFVTYRNTDPLFSVDLSDPENPRILGELKITGFSQYLHFYGENKLLGIGWETEPDTGNRLGLKCSMFDIAEPSNVKEVDKLVLGNVGSCEALDHYKGILISPDKNLFGFAYIVYDRRWNEDYYYGVFSYSEEKGFEPLAYLEVPEKMAEGYWEYSSLRGIYIGSTFYLAGEKGIQSYDMNADFERTAGLYWDEK